jgi:hypothetical protein
VSQFSLAAGAIHSRLGLPELTPANWPAEVVQLAKMAVELQHF